MTNLNPDAVRDLIEKGLPTEAALLLGLQAPEVAAAAEAFISSKEAADRAWALAHDERQIAERVKREAEAALQTSRDAADTLRGERDVISNREAAVGAREHASRGKVARAEPISALYEQGRVHHVGSHPQLEDQMIAFTTQNAGGQPANRVDALVWALSELFDNITAARRPIAQMPQRTNSNYSRFGSGPTRTNSRRF